MQQSGEISAVIPMYNAENTIALCLENIFSRLKNLKEVIVVDDCSSDSSREIAGRFPCRILKSDRHGFAGRARNIGVRKANGRIVLFIDSDILLKEDISEKIIRFIKPDKNIIAVVGIFSEEHPNHNLISQYKNLHARYKYCILPDFISSLHTSITAIGRESFWKAGGFDELCMVEDVEFGERITRQGYRIYLDKEMEVIHLKKFTLGRMLETDYRKVAGLAKHFLKIKGKKRIFKDRLINDISFYLPLSMVSGCIIIPFFIAGIFYKPLLIIMALGLVVFIGANIKFWKYLKRVKGIKFAAMSSAITFIDMNCAGVAFGAAFINRIFSSLHRER